MIEKPKTTPAGFSLYEHCEQPPNQFGPFFAQTDRRFTPCLKKGVMSKLFSFAFARAALEKLETLPQRPTHVPLILNLAKSSAATYAVPLRTRPRRVTLCRKR